MAKASGLLKLQQGKILRAPCTPFLKDLDVYGTEESPGKPYQLKTHNRTRLRRYAATGEHTTNKLQKELCIDASARTVQRELQRCKPLAYKKANKSPCMTKRPMKLRVEWVECQLRDQISWSRVVFSNEKKFNLDEPDGCNYYWHDLRSDKKITRSHHSGGRFVIVWDGMSALTAYLFKLTDDVHDGDYVFQRDNAIIYRARATKDFLADLNITTMD